MRLLAPAEIGAFTYRFLSVGGRLIQSGDMLTAYREIEVNIPNGLYILNLKNMQGEQAVYRLVKQ